MTEINIEQPNGYLLDVDGRVVLRFANWQTGTHQVSNHVNGVEYVAGPSDHSKEVHADYSVVTV